MALNKTRSSRAAFAHAVTYAAAYLTLRPSWQALLLIAASHFVIDRWRLARYVVWAKNWIGPFWQIEEVRLNALLYPKHSRLQKKGRKVKMLALNPPWFVCRETGYAPNVPQWMAVWLLIITDNCLHLICNALALGYFG